MSVPIAVTGAVPTTRMSSGVISEAPPIPVIPTRIPIPSPSATTAGSIAEPYPSALDPDLRVGQERLESPGELLRRDVSERDALEHRPQVGADGDPDVPEPLRGTGVVEILGGGLVDVGERTLDGADYVGDRHLLRRPREPVAAAGAAAGADQAGVLELEQDVLEELEGDVLRVGD